MAAESMPTHISVAFSGPARDLWPQCITATITPDNRVEQRHVGTTIDAITEAIVIERPIVRGSDMTRRIGIFANLPGQIGMQVYMYGFVKHASLHGQGNWNG